MSSARWAKTGGALAYALSGKLRQAQRLREEVANKYPEDTILTLSLLPTVQAAIEIRKHKPAQAVELLRMSTSVELGGFDWSSAPVYTRGQAYLALHKGTEAAAEFQKILDHSAGIQEPLALLGMARARVLQGETAKALAEYEQFLDLWKNADPDIPILREAKAEYAKLKEGG